MAEATISTLCWLTNPAFMSARCQLCSATAQCSGLSSSRAP